MTLTFHPFNHLCGFPLSPFWIQPHLTVELKTRGAWACWAQKEPRVCREHQEVNSHLPGTWTRATYGPTCEYVMVKGPRFRGAVTNGSPAKTTAMVWHSRDRLKRHFHLHRSNWHLFKHDTWEKNLCLTYYSFLILDLCKISAPQSPEREIGMGSLLAKCLRPISIFAKGRLSLQIQVMNFSTGVQDFSISTEQENSFSHCSQPNTPCFPRKPCKWQLPHS